MKKIIKILVPIIFVIIASLFGFKCVKKSDNSIKTIRLNEVTHSIFYAPQYVAMKNGYFKEENLNIELVAGQGADKVMTAVLSGSSDIGLAGPEASIYVYNEGKEDYTEVFAQLTKRDGSFLVSKIKQEDFKWDNVKGCTIIPGRRGGMPFMTFEYVLKRHGIDTKKDVILDDSIKFDLMAGAFTGSNAEYVTLFEPTATMTEEAGKGYIVASVGEESGEIPYTAYFAKKSYIEKNKDIIKKFTKAIYKGELFVKEHSSEEIANVIMDYFPGTDLSLLTKVVDRYKKIDAYSNNPVLSKDSFERLQDVMIEAGELEKRGDYLKIVNNDFANEVIK